MKIFFKVFALAVVFAACNSTGGHLISLPFEIGGVDRPAGGPLFFSSVGTGKVWNIELDQAVISAGPFYFNAQPPETAVIQSGVVIFEVTTQAIVDTLDPALHPIKGGGSGETAHAQSVEVDLFPPDTTQDQTDPRVQELSSPSAAISYIAGTASLAALDGGAPQQIIPFQGQLVIDLSKANPADPPPALQRVAGAQVDALFGVQSAALEARIDPTHWFDSADFSTLIPPPPSCSDGGTSNDGGCGPVWTPDAGALTWDKTSAFNTNVVTGIKAQSGVYLFHIVGGAQ